MENRPGFSFYRLPSTRLGWWAVGLAAAFLALFVIDVTLLIPFRESQADPASIQSWLAIYVILMLLCGLAGGILGLIAVIKRFERSWLVWLAIVLGAFVLFLATGELLQGL